MNDSLLSQIKQDTLALLGGTLRRLRDHWLLVLIYLVVVAAIVALMLPHDRVWHVQAYTHRQAHPPLARLASALRDWGAFIDTLVVSTGIFLLGLWRRRRAWRIAALACFLSGILGGLSVNTMRMTLGRPRPPRDKINTAACQPDRLHGPSYFWSEELSQYNWFDRLQKANRYQSFPSGHAGTSSGHAAGLLMVLPLPGAAMTVSAAGVLWSCVYAGKHYVADTFAGACLGILFGVTTGLTGRQMMRRVAGGPSRRRRRRRKDTRHTP